MENKDERNVNLIIKNQEEEETEHIAISITGIFRTLKRFLALWIAVSVIASLLAGLVLTLTNIKVYKETQALVNFTYNGIEKGKDPNGNKFDINSIKDPNIISDALDHLCLEQKLVDSVRNSISFESVIPQDAYDRITAYNEIIDKNSSGSSVLSAVEKKFETTYYATTYKVYFNYSGTSFSGNEAAAVLNEILNCYSQNFLKKYGYNETFGTAISAIDTKGYDYAEIVDIYDSSLESLKTYVSNLDKSDTIRFRSEKTGLSFADLSEQIETLRNTDLAFAASDITVNVVTNDLEKLKTFYKYRIETLKRKENIYREEVAAITDSINAYEKNSITIFGAGTEDMNTTVSEASEAYDGLFARKLEAQKNLSTTIQNVAMYEERLNRINSGVVSTESQKKEVERKIADLDAKVKALVEKIEECADEYYNEGTLSKAFNILVPASVSAKSFVKSALKDSIFGIAIVDVLIFVIYLGYCVVLSCIEEYNKTHKAVKAGNDGNSDKEKEKNKK